MTVCVQLVVNIVHLIWRGTKVPAKGNVEVYKSSLDRTPVTQTPSTSTVHWRHDHAYSASLALERRVGGGFNWWGPAWACFMQSDAKINILHDWQVILKAAYCFEICCPTKKGLVTK